MTRTELAPTAHDDAEPARNGIQVRIDSDPFDFAVMLVLNPEKVFSWDETSEEFGITVERSRGIFRQLVKHGIVEYVAPGQYRASVALRRMVAMHGPSADAMRRAGPFDGLGA